MQSVLPARSDDIMHPVNRVQASDPSLPRKVELAQDQSPASGDTAHGLARKAEHVHSRAFSDSIAQPLHALGPRPLPPRYARLHRGPWYAARWPSDSNEFHLSLCLERPLVAFAVQPLQA